MPERVSIIREDYISNSWPLYQQQYGTEAEKIFSSFVLDNLTRIKKRPGAERHRKIHEIFSAALNHLFESGQSEWFNEGIQLLLEEYYDPMYQYQLKKNPSKLYLVVQILKFWNGPNNTLRQFQGKFRVSKLMQVLAENNKSK